MSTALKSYTDILKVELEMINFGKTKEEQEEAITSYMTSFVKEVKKAVSGIPGAEERIDQLFENPDHLFDMD